MASSGDDTTDANSGPFLQQEIMSLKGLELIIEQEQQAEPAQSAPEPEQAAPSPVVQERKPSEKKPVKPKWLKM
jgi:tether containing UBX domain for GLUT4